MKNKIQLLISLLALLFVISCSSSKKITSDVPTDQANVELVQAVENALLWEITGPNVQVPSYLFGTIHIIDTEDFFWPKGTLASIDKATKVVFEIDMAEMNNLGAQMSLLKDAFMDDGIELKDLLAEDEYSMVKAHFEKMGLPIFFFERIKPMFLTVFASPDMDPKAIQSGEMVSYEMKILELAEAQDMGSAGLESIDFQLSLFDSIPYQDQADMLVESINSSQEGADQFNELVEIYKAQDLAAMDKMMESEEMGDGDFNDFLLKNRNLRWIPIIEEMVQKESHFIAVGAGHLGGKYGVVNLLRDKGLTLKPISN